MEYKNQKWEKLPFIIIKQPYDHSVYSNMLRTTYTPNLGNEQNFNCLSIPLGLNKEIDSTDKISPEANRLFSWRQSRDQYVSFKRTCKLGFLLKMQNAFLDLHGLANESNMKVNKVQFLSMMKEINGTLFNTMINDFLISRNFEPINSSNQSNAWRKKIRSWASKFTDPEPNLLILVKDQPLANKLLKDALTILIKNLTVRSFTMIRPYIILIIESLYKYMLNSQRGHRVTCSANWWRFYLSKNKDIFSLWRSVPKENLSCGNSLTSFNKFADNYITNSLVPRLILIGRVEYVIHDDHCINYLQKNKNYMATESVIIPLSNEVYTGY